MALLLKNCRHHYLQTAIFVLFASLVLGVVYQHPFTYTINLGQADDDWAIVRGFGDAEQNDSFGFRWTIDQNAELRLPDVGWPNRLGIIGLAPRPNNSDVQVTFAINNMAQLLLFSPKTASLPPDEYGRLTFELLGATPTFKLTPNELVISSDLFQPAGDPRQLGVVVSQIYLKPAPSRFGLIIPPLTPFFGWLWLVGLLYFNLASQANRQKRLGVWLLPSLPVLLLVLIGWLQLSFPTWLAINGASIAWGTALPLLFWTISRYWQVNRRNLVLSVPLILVTLLVFYELALAPFAAVGVATTGLIFLIEAIKNRFSNQLENVGLLVGFSAPLGWGLWQDRLPRAHDYTDYHLYWINELVRLLEQGNLYPRWAADFTWGQGWPTFNYYPPLGRYLPAIFHFLGVANYNNALLLVLYFATIFGMVGCYFWCVELIGDKRGAILGSIAFCYLPYSIVQIYTAGMLANSLGGTILPWVGWQLTRLIRQPQNRFTLIWLGLTGASLAITSTPQLIVFLPVVAVYGLGLALLEWRTNLAYWLKGLGRGIVAVGLAIGLSAFFILPATFEIDQVTLKFTRPGLEDSSRFWSILPSIFNFWIPIYHGVDAYSYFTTLHFWLAVGGGLILWRTHSLKKSYLVLLGLACLWAVFLQFPPSRPFWETFSAMTAVQFSSRLMFTFALFAAPLIGGLAIELKYSQHNWAMAGLAAAIIGLLLYGCYNSLDYKEWPLSFRGELSQKALTEQIGNGDIMYLPKGVSDIAAISRYNSPAFLDGRAPTNNDKLDWQRTGTDSYRLTAVASSPVAVSVPLFWLAGWWQVHDETGQQYNTNPTSQTHHIMLNLPKGTTTLIIKLQDTPLRHISNLISFLAVITTLILAIGFF